MILQLQPLLERYHLKVDPSHLEAASRLFPLTGSIDTWAYSLLFKLFYSIGEQIPLVLSFDNLQYMAVSYTHLDVYKRQGNGWHGSGRLPTATRNHTAPR